MRNENIYKMIVQMKKYIKETKPEYEGKNKIKTLCLKDFLLYATLRGKKNVYDASHDLDLAKIAMNEIVKKLEYYIKSYDENLELEKKSYHYLNSQKYYNDRIGIHTKEDLLDLLNILKEYV